MQHRVKYFFFFLPTNFILILFFDFEFVLILPTFIKLDTYQYHLLFVLIRVSSGYEVSEYLKEASHFFDVVKATGREISMQVNGVLISAYTPPTVKMFPTRARTVLL